MEWYEWVFDGIGTALVGLISGIISYKAAVKKVSKQKQSAGDASRQTQEITIENSKMDENVQDTIDQTQKAGRNSEQLQIGRISDG